MQTNAKIRKNIIAVFFLLPAVFFLIVYVLYPIFDVFHLSRFAWNGIDPEKTYVGLDNWKKLLADQYFWGAARHNILILVLSIIVQMPLAILLAFLLDGMGRKSGPLKVIYYLPSLFSTSAVGLLFTFIYNPRNGVFTTISKLMGGKTVDVLGKPGTALFAVFSVICWTAVPYYMIFYLAALAGLPQEVFDAARIDGASKPQYFFRVVLPMLKNSIKTACTLSMVGSLKYFDLIYIMTEGGPNNSSDLMATYMYRTTFKSRQMGYGAAIAAGMFIVITAVVLIIQYLFNRNSEEV